MNALLYLWQLPQNVLGLLITKLLKVYWGKRYGFFFAYLSKPTRAWSGVSLGNYIIFSGYPDYKTLLHEYGHQRQSQYLGPLYLLIIGLPSLVGNVLHRFIKFDYYKQPWEAWADKLGNVPRYAGAL